MRKCIFVAMFIMGHCLFAQKGNVRSMEIPGWEVRDNKLVWSRVYFAESKNIQDFIKGLHFLAKSSSFLSLSDKGSETMTGTFSNLTLKYEEFGYNLIDTPFLISRARHSGNIEVEIKEGRYKVVISDVVSFLNTAQKKGSVYKWNEDFLDRKGEIKNEMKETLVLTDKNFAISFDVKTQSTANKKP